ncbi:AAA family ATPase [Nocardia sp. NPDC050793]|uniref:ParA family protein n=1 Tax=Nocardia sp. NPDC050793 TaxID=3155159 RepID=UPI0033E7CA0E
MTDVAPTEGNTLLASLPDSAWIREGIEDPGNSLAILGKKGGTGKTTLTQLLLDAGVRFGLNMLGIDGDPQGNLSIALDNKVRMVDTGRVGLGNRKVLEPDRLTLVEVLLANEDGVVDEGFQLSGWEYDPTADFTRGGPLIPGKIGTVGIVPAYKALEDVSRGWNISDLGRLDRALNAPLAPGGVPPRLRWDVVMSDMLPGGSDLARAQLKAMRKFLLLTTAEPFGINAIADTLDFGRDIRENWDNPRLEALGLVFTSYNPQGIVTRAELADLRAAQEAGSEAVDIEIWDPRVPTRTVVPKAQGYRAPVSALLAESRDRNKAMEMCQVAEAVLLRILHKIGHPDVQELEQRWRAAWPDLSPWATGAISEKETQHGA